VEEGETSTEGSSEGSESESEAVFEIVESESDGASFSSDEEVIVATEIENTGESAGEQSITLEMADEQIGSGELQLEAGESSGYQWSYDYSDFNPGTWDATIYTEDDEMDISFTIEEPQQESSDASYQVRIKYDGEWSGSVGGDGSSRSVDGSGTETFDVDGDPYIVSANAQKRDSGSGELVVEILQDGEVIASKRTSAEYGVAQVTSEDGIDEGSDSDSTEDSNGSGSSYEVRIEYDGEWSGSVGSGGSTSSVDGSGTETIEIDGSPDIISANAQKQDDSSNELTIQILEDGEVVEEGSTTASYGVAQISHSNF
jgi:hypothetical protein